MLTKSGAKLLDFGLAKVAPAPASGVTAAATLSSSLTTAGAVVGTFQYMSPEHPAPKTDYDLWLLSLGAPSGPDRKPRPYIQTEAQEAPEKEGASPITVVLNWTAGLKR